MRKGKFEGTIEFLVSSKNPGQSSMENYFSENENKKLKKYFELADG